MIDSEQRLATAERSLTEVEELFALFGLVPPEYRAIDSSAAPQPEQTLLDHERHMTVTLEQFHNSPMHLTVLDEIHREPFYARRILLSSSEQRVVQYGIMRIDLRRVEAKAREQILGGGRPLGRILIEHRVLRRISMHGLLAIRPTEEMAKTTNSAPEAKLYGRLATILCNESPAVDLLEVVCGLPKKSEHS